MNGDVGGRGQLGLNSTIQCIISILADKCPEVVAHWEPSYRLIYLILDVPPRGTTRSPAILLKKKNKTLHRLIKPLLPAPAFS